MTPIRVLVVDADALARRALRDLLANVEGLEVCATAGNIVAGVVAVAEHDIDVVLMDARLGCDERLSAIRRIHEARSNARVLILSTSDDHELGLRALRDNAAGFLSKDVHLDALGRIVHSLARGEVVITRAMTATVIAEMRTLGPRRITATRGLSTVG